MAAMPLKVSRNEQRSVICFRWAKGQRKMPFSLRCVQCILQVFYETSNTCLM